MATAALTGDRTARPAEVVADAGWPELRPGTRVRLPGGSHVLRLRSRLGTVVGPAATSPGHYLVRLDKPARYDNGVAPARRLDEIVEAADNLRVIPAP